MISIDSGRDVWGGATWYWFPCMGGGRLQERALLRIVSIRAHSCGSMRLVSYTDPCFKHRTVVVVVQDFVVLLQNLFFLHRTLLVLYRALFVKCS